MNKTLLVMLIVLNVITIVISGICLYFVIQISNANKELFEEQENLSDVIQAHVDETAQQFIHIQEDRRLDKIMQDHDDKESRRFTHIVHRLTKDDEEIIGILVEKTQYDYIEKGLDYYDEQAYSQAYNAFSRALSYDADNTTVLFYKIYCLYLASMNNPANEETYRIISDGIEIINKNGYKKNELLRFTETLMHEITADMAVNISGWRRG